jgi:DNA-binding CsgD family transcriptional regulator
MSSVMPQQVECRVWRNTLTSLELEVLAHMADGRRAAETSEILGTTTNAVGLKVHAIKNKLGAATSAGAVARAFRLGILK